MNKLEKGLFENLTQNSGFYIKDYYSEYLNSSKWMAILENNDFVYAVIVCKYNDCDFEYEEAKVFLEKNYFKKISLCRFRAGQRTSRCTGSEGRRRKQGRSPPASCLPFPPASRAPASASVFRPVPMFSARNRYPEI